MASDEARFGETYILKQVGTGSVCWQWHDRIPFVDGHPDAEGKLSTYLAGFSTEDAAIAYMRRAFEVRGLTLDMRKHRG